MLMHSLTTGGEKPKDIKNFKKISAGKTYTRL